MGNLLTFSFWFKGTPGRLTQSSVFIIAGYIVMMFVSAIIIKIVKNNSTDRYFKKVLRKVNSMIITMNIVIMFIFFFAFENIPILAARGWFLVWGIGLLLWLYFIIRDIIKIPKMRDEYKKEIEYKKYIP